MSAFDVRAGYEDEKVITELYMPIRLKYLSEWGSPGL